MAQNLLDYLTTYAAAHGRDIDRTGLDISTATEPGTVKAWLDDIGRLAVDDLYRTVLADAFDRILDLADETRLDGNLGTHLSHLHTVLDAAVDLEDQHHPLHTRVLEVGDRLGILTPLNPPPGPDEPPASGVEVGGTG
jgi:hypothetical protein